MRILELAVFILATVVFAVIEGSFLHDLFFDPSGIDRSAERFMLGALAAGLYILYRWVRRLWHLRTRTSEASKNQV